MGAGDDAAGVIRFTFRAQKPHQRLGIWKLAVEIHIRQWPQIGDIDLSIDEFLNEGVVIGRIADGEIEIGLFLEVL